MIERCLDLRRVRRFADMDLYISDKVFYLIEVQNGEDAGILAFIPTFEGLMVHVAMTEACRGRAALRAYRDAFAWIFENTHHERIRGEVPTGNRAACFMAKHSGAKFDVVDAQKQRCYSLDKQDFMDARGAL